MLRVVQLVVLLTLCGAAPAQGQSAISATRGQRLVVSVHLPKLRPPVASATRFTPQFDLHAFQRREPVLRHQLRFPLTPRMDLSVAGRIGWFGLASTLRLRLRF